MFGNILILKQITKSCSGMESKFSLVAQGNRLPGLVLGVLE